ncbi:MAG: ABC transporter ATP-binding protein [Alphaproteobacteria bacterium]|nr:ABC transporter ATP-binding protein [Alphaproteobacteria bacterium]
MALLEVRGLCTEFRTPDAVIPANAGVSFNLDAGRTLGIVGESGSGKSVLCRALLGLIQSPPGFVTAGEIVFDGRDLRHLDETTLRRVRGTAIAMIFQNPMSGLNPVWPVGDQISEGLRVHRGLSPSAARARGIAMMRQVGIPSPEVRYDEYPHQWSGGMLQRAMIAMAMACEPKLLLADEPTTALDVTIQDQILALLVELQERTGMAMILVSHDMAVIAETSDHVAVMYAGRMVEVAPTAAAFRTPRHPYTLGLLQSIPRAAGDGRLTPIPGQPPNLARLGDGCPFADRCAVASPECRTRPVALREIDPGHWTACHFPERLAGLQA